MDSKAEKGGKPAASCFLSLQKMRRLNHKSPKLLINLRVFLAIPGVKIAALKDAVKTFLKSGFFSISLLIGLSFISTYPNNLGAELQHSIRMKKARKLHHLSDSTQLTGRMKENFSQSEIYMELDSKGTPHGMFYAIEKSKSSESSKVRISGWGVFEDGQPVRITKFEDNGSSLELSYSLGGRLSEISLKSEGKTVTQQFNLPAEKPLRNLKHEDAPELDPSAARKLQDKIDSGQYESLKEIITQIPEKKSGLASALAAELNLENPRVSKESYMQFLASETSIKAQEESLYPSESELAESLPGRVSYSLSAQAPTEFGSSDISNSSFPDFSAPEIQTGKRDLRISGSGLSAK